LRRAREGELADQKIIAILGLDVEHEFDKTAAAEPLRGDAVRTLA